MTKNISKIILLIGFTLLCFIVILLTLLTYAFPEIAMHLPFFETAMKYHFELMSISFFLALVFGFLWNYSLQGEISNKDKKLKTLTTIVLQFLSKEERTVIEHLVEHGSIKQSEIGYINNMGRVKAMRTVQKLELRHLVTIEPFGKQRIVKLVDSITAD